MALVFNWWSIHKDKLSISMFKLSTSNFLFPNFNFQHTFLHNLSEQFGRHRPHNQNPHPFLLELLHILNILHNCIPLTVCHNLHNISIEFPNLLPSPIANIPDPLIIFHFVKEQFAHKNTLEFLGIVSKFMLLVNFK